MDKRAFTFIGALIALAFLAGRFSAPEKIKVETKVEVHEVDKSREEKSGEKIEVTTQITKPDGTKISRTRSEARHESRKEDDKSIQSKTVMIKEITARKGVVVGPMVGMSTSDLLHPFFGGFVDAQVLGPAHIASCGFFGPSIGLAVTLGAGWEF